MKRSIIEDKRSNAMQLSGEELERYSRHLMMPEVTPDGQRHLKAARVLCIGAGGLGSPAALYLAAAGVGTIGIVDFDDVDLSNLQRQILHGTKDVGRGKLEPAPDTVPNCAEAGVLGVLPGIIGMLQAIETIKLIVGIGEPLVGRLLYVDALRMKFRELNLRRDPQCPVCGENPTIFSPIDYEQFCGARAVRDDDGLATINVHELKRKMENNGAFAIVDVREEFEYDIPRIEGST